MPLTYQLTIRRAVPVPKTPRVLQLSGLFDLPPTDVSEQTWPIEFTLPDQWQVGLVVGPSGCGKSTIARELWGKHLAKDWEWPAERSIVDGFPGSMGIKEITNLLCSVGFSSPPSWLRPFPVLSNGEQFRVTIARTLAEQPDLAVVDEFTSVVDRDVARIASAAVAKAVRKRGQQFIAVTCHYDVAEWLQPDWIYQPHTGEFVAGRLLRRPSIQLDVRRVHPSAWEFFKQHHYLSAKLHPQARCFVAFWANRPTAFCSVLPFPHPRRPGWREHRTVCLPEFQGVGIGSALAEFVAGLYRATGRPYRSVTSNPGYIQHRLRSRVWKCIRKASLNNKPPSAWARRTGFADTRASDRLTWGFEYVGPARVSEARGFGVVTR